MPDWASGLVKMSMNAQKAAQPCDICFGRVQSVSPLRVSVEELKVTLEDAMLLVPEHLQEQKVQVEGADGMSMTLRIPSQVQLGSRVALLRKTGGQKYMLLGTLGK